ncbi:hypothetical protein KBC31_01540 [Candidatus Saccharibacteria bacterium]|jgi:hypothetical protein|nr:hypothetical protein [Candidatus Saccharibacteria bacterium]
MKINKELNAAKLLLPYLFIMLGTNILLHIFIAVRGNNIDIESQLFLAIIAIYYIYFNQIKANKPLSKIRFGKLVGHFIGYLIVNLGYFIHAYVLLISDSDAIKFGGGRIALNPGWFGVLFGMATFWGIGLLIHTIASVASRGYEDLSRK